jgi:hypothetical protein
LEGETVQTAISKLTNEMPECSNVCLIVGGKIISNLAPISQFQNSRIDVTFELQRDMVRLQMSYFGDVFPVTVAPGRTFAHVRRNLASTFGIPLANLRLECEGKSITDEQPFSLFSGRVIEIRPDFGRIDTQTRKIDCRWGVDKLSKNLNTNSAVKDLRTSFAKDFKVGVGAVRLLVGKRQLGDDEIMGEGKTLVVTLEAPGLILTYRRPDGSLFESRPQFPYTRIGVVERASEEGQDFEFWQNGTRVDPNRLIKALTSLTIDLHPRG